MGFDKLVYLWTAILPLVVVLYYFFRKRYDLKTISSTLFWEQSMRETKVSPYFKNLQKNALFYLQIAALLLLFFVLLGPYLDREDHVGSSTIIIVDTSATMLATKNNESLFDANRKQIKDLIGKREGYPITIIRTGKEPEVIVREETDVGKINKAIDDLEVTYEHEHMDVVMEFTRSIVSSGNEDIHVFTDSYNRSDFPEDSSSNMWTVHGSNTSYNNISIDKFGAVKTVDGLEAVVKITNQSDSAQTGEIQILDGVNGEELTLRPFTVEARKDLLLSIKNLPDSLALQAVLKAEDDYVLDNEAVILLGTETTDAIVDSNLHELVKRAFEVVGLTVTSGSRSEMTAAQSSSLVVTNDVSFYRTSNSPVVLIGRNDKSTKPVSGNVLTSNDPLFTVVPMNDVYISELYPPFKGLKTIATIDNLPFIQKSERGDIIVLTDIELSDWPLHPSFPLFAWSAAESIQAEGGSIGAFSPNERKALLASGQSTTTEVFTINDEYTSSYPTGSNFVAPFKPGIYKMIDEESKEKLFTVQLEQIEKQLIPGDTYQIGEISETDRVEVEKHGFAWIILLLVLLLLASEWEVQRRYGHQSR